MTEQLCDAEPGSGLRTLVAIILVMAAASAAIVGLAAPAGASSASRPTAVQCTFELQQAAAPGRAAAPR
jgi:hypothetical protein